MLSYHSEYINLERGVLNEKVSCNCNHSCFGGCLGFGLFRLLQKVGRKWLVSRKNQTAGVYKKISAKEAKDLIDAGGVILIDARTQAEFDQGHIEGAILLPEYEVAQKAEQLIPDKDAKILVYCRTGRRSAIAAKEFIKLGYTDVSDFGGLQTDWPYDVVK